MSKSSLSFILGSKAVDAPSPATNDSPAKKTSCPYEIGIIQQPSFCKASHHNQHSNNARVQAPPSEHRPIHPPPVLKLMINESMLSADAKPNHLNRFEGQLDENKKVLQLLSSKYSIPTSAHYSSFFVAVDIIPEDGEINSENNKKSLKMAREDVLSGSKVSSGMVIKLPTTNDNLSYTAAGKSPKKKNRECDYSICFVFGDISVRKVGDFRLLFKLYEFRDSSVIFRHEVVSNKFSSFNPKKFPGAIPSTDLTRFLYKYGAKVRQRKSKTENHDSQADSIRKRSASFDSRNEHQPPIKRVNYGDNRQYIQVNNPYLSSIAPQELCNTLRNGHKVPNVDHAYMMNNYSVPPPISSPISPGGYYPSPRDEYHPPVSRMSPHRYDFANQSTAFAQPPYSATNAHCPKDDRRILISQNNIQQEVNYRQPQVLLAQPSGEKQRMLSVPMMYNHGQSTHIPPGPLTAPLIESRRGSLCGPSYFQPPPPVSRRSSNALFQNCYQQQAQSQKSLPPVKPYFEQMQPFRPASSSAMHSNRHTGFHAASFHDQRRHQQVQQHYMYDQSQRQFGETSSRHERLPSLSHYLY